MSHVSRLIMTGEIPGRGKKVSSYYSWPSGECQREVERLVHTFRNTYTKVTIVIQHNYID